MKGRALAVWLLLFAAYASTLGLDARSGSDYGNAERHYLAAIESFAEDGDGNVADELAERGIPRTGIVQPDGRVFEPYGIGFAALMAPAYALGGETAVELLLAAIAALAGALAYALARRFAPDPWALGAALACGLSPPMLAYGTAVVPDPMAAALLTGAALAALKVRDMPRRRYGVLCFALLGLLPWLGPKFIPAALVLGGFAVVWLRRGRRPLLALVSVEIALFSVAFYVGLNEALYGGATPWAAASQGGPATGADTVMEYLERVYRPVALMVDREYGLLRWAPVFALAGVGVFLLWRGHRHKLTAILTEHGTAEAIAALCAAVFAAQLFVATFLVPTAFGGWFPARELIAVLPVLVPLVTWGLRRIPRTGLALIAITLVGSVWLWLDVRFGDGGLVAGRPDAPWGPLVKLFPVYGESAYPYVLSAVLALAVAALAYRLRDA
ncbi:MAG: hypothetical protein H0V29_09140 [Thermoleophilaceae bacterium]|nr:hypothetical protein [Thermoleophilaceae bacterium]